MTSAAAPWTSTRSVWREHPGYIMAWALNVAAAALLGGTAIGCDPARFTAPTWDGLRSSLGVDGFGLALLAYSAVLIIGAWLPARGMMAAFWAGAATYLTIAYYFGVGLADPRAAPWGPIICGLVGAWQITQAEAYRQSARDPS